MPSAMPSAVVKSQKCSIILTLSASLLMEVTLMGTGTAGEVGVQVEWGQRLF